MEAESTTDEFVAGDCYANAYKMAVSLYQDMRDADVLICHGNPKCTAEGEHNGVRMGHAWVEINDALVLDWLGALPREIYYKAGEITFVRRYTLAAALKLMHARDSYGPWDKRLARLLHKSNAHEASTRATPGR